MLSLTLSGLSLPTLHLPLKGLSTTFGSAPGSQKLFGLNSTNIGAARPVWSTRRPWPPSAPTRASRERNIILLEDGFNGFNDFSCQAPGGVPVWAAARGLVLERVSRISDSL